MSGIAQTGRRKPKRNPDYLSVLLEVLDFALVLLRLLEARKCPEIPPLTCGRILLARVQPIFAGFEFANHIRVDAARPAPADWSIPPTSRSTPYTLSPTPCPPLADNFPKPATIELETKKARPPSRGRAFTILGRNHARFLESIDYKLLSVSRFFCLISSNS